MADRELIVAIILAGLLVEAADKLINALTATHDGHGKMSKPRQTGIS